MYDQIYCMDSLSPMFERQIPLVPEPWQQPQLDRIKRIAERLEEMKNRGCPHQAVFAEVNGDITCAVCGKRIEYNPLPEDSCTCNAVKKPPCNWCEEGNLKE